MVNCTGKLVIKDAAENLILQCNFDATLIKTCRAPEVCDVKCLQLVLEHSLS